MAPGAITQILDNAIFMSSHLNGCDLQSVTIAVLLDLGIPTQKAGFEYLKIAIVRFAEEPGCAFSEGVYQRVAGHYAMKLTHSQIEQAIRSVIGDAWKNRDGERWCGYFPQDRVEMRKQPSNLEFITRIGYFLELCQGCCREVNYVS